MCTEVGQVGQFRALPILYIRFWFGHGAMPGHMDFAHQYQRDAFRRFSACIHQEDDLSDAH